MADASREGPPPSIGVPRLTKAECIRRGENHLAYLSEHQQIAVANARATSWPRTRAHCRRLVLGAVWLQEVIRRAWRRTWNPQHRLGQVAARVRLLSPSETLNAWVFGSALLLAAMIWLKFVKAPLEVDKKGQIRLIDTGFGKTLTDTLLALALGGLLAALWTNLFRCPWAIRRIRRRISRDPGAMLLTNLGAREEDLIPRNDPLRIVPRTELYYDVLPGVLARDHKDLQIVVGEPGSGKTTALLGLASLLAKLGIVPVLVPLRSERNVNLVELANSRFRRQIEAFVRSDGEAEVLWSWLSRRRRVAILADDIDQIGPDGERGFVMRQTLLEASTYGLPIIVTARPAGVPAGIAASAIQLAGLDEETIIDSAVEGAKTDPGFKESYLVPRKLIATWIREGRLTEVPFYVELLAQLVAAGECRRLVDASSMSAEVSRPGRYRLRPDGLYEWNPLWVRFQLLELFVKKARSGRIRPWLGIEPHERMSALNELEKAALGSLVATGIKAKAARRGRREREQEVGMPQRWRLEEFISTEDRDPGRHTGPTTAGHKLRSNVSVNEVTDTGERLRILDRDGEGHLQFRHRIMQAYLAGCCLATRYRRGQRDTQHLALPRWIGDDESAPPRLPDDEPNWLEYLLDPHHPEKLTANMAVTFAALVAETEKDFVRERRPSAEEVDAPEADAWEQLGRTVIRELVQHAERSQSGQIDPAPHADGGIRRAIWRDGRRLVAPADQDERDGPVHGRDDLQPMRFVDPERRADPDDALIKLTTAADVARAIECPCGKGQRRGDALTQEQIVRAVEKVAMTTRWTKLEAIRAVAALDTPERWKCIWQFARDPDYMVRRAATHALKVDATRAYQALEQDFHALILRAAARSSLHLALTRPEREAHEMYELHAGVELVEAGDLHGISVPLRRPHLPHPHVGVPRPHLPVPPLRLHFPRLLPNTQEELAQRARRAAAHVPTPPVPTRSLLNHANGDEPTYDIRVWRDDEEVPKLRALGWVLPSIVSGLHEDPFAHLPEAWHGVDDPAASQDVRPSRYPAEENVETTTRYFPAYTQSAGTALRRLVALACERGHDDLEESLAQGFKSDAMRHAESRELQAAQRVTGPGWVASNRQLVTEMALNHATSWYARMLLYQALALYTIAGADAESALDAFAAHLHRGGPERHPITQRAARLARAGLRRYLIGRPRWTAYIWREESESAGRRATHLDSGVAQLLADVTILLDLKEGSQDDSQRPFGSMRQLPYCLSQSRDRREILATGCAEGCGWGLCPYKQSPPDEPNAQRGVSRAFCRQQRQIARHHLPDWQRSIKKKSLQEFWRAMEERSRN